MSDVMSGAVAGDGVPAVPAGPKTGVFRRIVRNPLGLISLIWLAVVVIVVVGAGAIAPYSATATDLSQTLSGPSWSHLLGTDQLGRDLLSRLMFGGLPSVQGVLVAVAVYAVVGLPLGLLAGYRGGWLDTAVGRVSEVLQTLPGMILLLVVLAVFGNNQSAAMAALGLHAAPYLIRVSRSVTLSVREELFVSAAKVFGLSDFMIVARHVLPRIRSTAIVQTALFAGAALMVQSSLAFLGFGPQPPNPSWGGMVGDASNVIRSQPWQIVPPGLAIGLCILALGLLGNAARDAVSETWSKSQAVLLRRMKHRRSPGTATTTDRSDGPLVQVRDLSVSVEAAGERVPVVRSINLDIARGEVVGMVGESGCGKTLASLGLIGVLPPGAEYAGGAVYLAGEDLTAMSSDELDRVRGRRIGYVSQDPALALDPMFTVGNQLREAVRRHRGGTREEANARVLELLTMVHLPEPETVARRHPHELSGGMAQRVCIALALAGEPELLIADEPTTALDVTTQAGILKLLLELKERTGMATLLVTHDWGVVAELCDRAVVMYAGQIVESGLVAELFQRPKHPYTAALLSSNPHIAVDSANGSGRIDGEPVTPLPTIPGTVPPPAMWGVGCGFAQRCTYATAACVAQEVPMVVVDQGHESRCLHSEQVTRVLFEPGEPLRPLP